MKILIVGSLENVPEYPELCSKFVRRLGEIIVESKDTTLLTGCRGSLDHAIAESAFKHLETLPPENRGRLESYRLKHTEPDHRFGKIHVSSLSDWNLTHPDLKPPEQFSKADIAIFIAGSEGTMIAANWARIAGKPILGIAQFGGAGAAIYEREKSHFEEKYSKCASKEDFDLLNQDTFDVEKLATEVISLAQRMINPSTVFSIMPLKTEFRDVFASYQTICKEFDFTADPPDKTQTAKRITSQILEGIQQAAFVIADITEMNPNVFYEVGYAQGIGKHVILTAKKDTEPPFDIYDFPILFWDCQEDLKAQLRSPVKKLAIQFGYPDHEAIAV